MRQDSPIIPRIMALLAAGLATGAALAGAAWWRLAPGELPHAGPWPGAALPAGPLAGGLGLAAAALAALAWRSGRTRAPGLDAATLAGALLWPALPLAAAWLVLPVAGPPTLRVLWLAPVLALGAWLWHVRPRPAAGPPPARRRGRTWWLGHALAFPLLGGAGWLAGGFADVRAVVLSLLLYPLYAWLQLVLVLGLSWPRLRRLAGPRPLLAAITVAALFALIHWPNPVLMALTGLGMLVWAREFYRGRPLWQLAISMGLLATVVAQGLPDTWTEHMRVGPGGVRLRAAPALAADAHQATASLAPGPARTRAFLAALYPATVGREATDAELDRWWRSLWPCRRAVLAWRFYVSPEYERRFGAPAGEAPLPGDVHWTRLPAPWPERIGTRARPLDGPTPPTPAAGDGKGAPAAWRPYLARLYREILRREPAPAELAAWSPALSPRQQQRLAEVLLDQRRDLARAPFDTLGCAEMLLHH